MKIAIFGAGGIGSFYGAMLQRGGADASFDARGRHLAAMLDSGLRVGVVSFDLFQNGVEPLAVPPSQRDTQIFLARKMIMNTRRFYSDRFGQMPVTEGVKPELLHQILSRVEKFVISRIFHVKYIIQYQITLSNQIFTLSFFLFWFRVSKINYILLTIINRTYRRSFGGYS